MGRKDRHRVRDAQGVAKEAAGRHGASLVEDGMRVGLGTGSTADYAIVALCERRLDIVCVATSKHTEDLAREGGLEIVEPGEVSGLDVAIDGADEVDRYLNLTKGGGGAHAREKVVAAMADRFVVVVDDAKLVDHLGTSHSLPVEVLGFAQDVVARNLMALGAKDVDSRDRISDNGNPILDAAFPSIEDPPALAAVLDAMPGVCAHGIFLSSLVEKVVVGRADGSVRTLAAGDTPLKRA